MPPISEAWQLPPLSVTPSSRGARGVPLAAKKRRQRHQWLLLMTRRVQPRALAVQPLLTLHPAQKLVWPPVRQSPQQPPGSRRVRPSWGWSGTRCWLRSQSRPARQRGRHWRHRRRCALVWSCSCRAALSTGAFLRRTKLTPAALWPLQVAGPHRRGEVAAQVQQRSSARRNGRTCRALQSVRRWPRRRLGCPGTK